MFGVAEDWVEVACGHDFTIARKEDNSLWGWGSNVQGKLGNNSIDNVGSPVSVSIAKQNWKKIVSGTDHTLALKADNTACAWGEGDYGQLGNNTAFDKSVPVNCLGPYSSGSTISWTSITVGDKHVTGIDGATGNLWIWGIRVFPTGNYLYYCSQPRSFSSSISWKQVASGLDYMIGIDGSTGLAYGYGENWTGQLGDGTATDASVPTSVSSTISWKEIKCGNAHTIGINGANGLAYGWGYNLNGELGINASGYRLVPTSVSSAISWKQISAGYNCTIGIDGSTGLAYAWGLNSYGNLGDNSMAPRSAPTSVSSTISWKEIKCGNTHTIGINGANGLAYGWGYNSAGQLGLNQTDFGRSVPTSVSSTISWKNIYTGSFHTIGINGANGLAYAWGDNDAGQLGLGDIKDRSVPTSISSTISWKEIASAAFDDIISTTLGINASDGALYGWGENSTGLIGNGSKTDTSTPVSSGIPEYSVPMVFKDIAAGGDFTIGIEQSTGLAYGWGNNVAGQLGDNSITNKYVPFSVSSTISWKQIACGEFHSIGINGANGLAYGWGNNVAGQLGDNSKTHRSVPVSVSSTISWKEVACGDVFTIGINGANGLAYGWGANDNGQLGDNTTSYRSVPTSISSTISWRTLAAGGNHVIAVRGSDESIWAWGSNIKYQCGYGTGLMYYLSKNPTSVSIKNIPVRTISAGYEHSAITRNDGSIWVWGYNDFGALGLGYLLTDLKSSPTPCSTTMSFRTIDTYYTTVLAIVDSTGLAYGWGLNSSGQVGNGKIGDVYEPVSVSSTISWKSISTCEHTIGINGANGLAYAWGRNDYGQLGINSTTDASVPTSVSSTISWKQIAVGHTYTGCHTIGISGQTGRGYGWGRNYYGQVGNNSATHASVPVSVNSTISWKQIACGNDHTVGINGSNGLAYSWGVNGSGQLGINASGNKSVPTSVSSTISWREIVCGDNHTIGINGANGLAYAWGLNSYGQLGDGTITNRSAPTSVSSTISWKQIKPNTNNVIGINGANGLAYAWGYNGNMELCDGTTTNRSVPTSVSSTISWRELYTTQYGVIGINGADEKLYHWGKNSLGELNTYIFRNDIPRPMCVIPGL